MVLADVSPLICTMPDTEISSPLQLVHVRCCVCDSDDVDPVGVGQDYEYRTSQDTFLAVRCRQCGLMYLSPRPAMHELDRIYPPTYHAFNFTPARFGLVYAVRRKLEARRLLRWCRDLPSGARVIDVGCGDGFHLRLLADYADKTFTIEGVDSDLRAVEAARLQGLTVHHGTLDRLALEPSGYDLALLIQTIEHVDDPPSLLRRIAQLLRPGGKLVIVTDNTDSVDRQLFEGSYWGGYHFPRHWNLFNKTSLTWLAFRTGFTIERISTIVSPVNWVYSVRNALVDLGAPRWLYERFSLSSTGSLALFTLLNGFEQVLGRGALLCAILRRPDAA